MNNIYLTGMPGAGKSTVARLLSKHTGYPSLDLDRQIEQNCGKTIPEIFKIFGEAFFREKEREALSACLNLKEHIIACGGGIQLDPHNIKVMRESGRILFIDRPLSFLKKTKLSNRPLLSGPEDIERIYFERICLYRSSADFTVTGNNVREIAERIARYLEHDISDTI